MFGKRKKPAHVAFDDRVKSYLIYLAYVKNSISLSIADKSDLFKTAEAISHDIFVSMEKLKASKVNSFNAREVEAAIAGTIKRIDRLIAAEMKKIEKLVVIDRSRAHSVAEAVESIVQSGPNQVAMSRDQVDRFFSVSKFFDPPAKPVDVKKETAKAAKEYDDDLHKLSLKAFMDTLASGDGQAVNPEAYFKAASILNDALRPAPGAARNALAPLPSFSSERDGGFSVSYRDHPVEIDLAIRVGDSGDRFTVDLRGRLADEGSSADFSINKRYFGSSRASVMNAFKLRILLEEWKRRSEGR